MRGFEIMFPQLIDIFLDSIYFRNLYSAISKQCFNYKIKCFILYIIIDVFNRCNIKTYGGVLFLKSIHYNFFREKKKKEKMLGLFVWDMLYHFSINTKWI